MVHGGPVPGAEGKLVPGAEGKLAPIAQKLNLEKVLTIHTIDYRSGVMKYGK